MATLRLSSWHTYHVYTHTIVPKDGVGGLIYGSGDGWIRGAISGGEKYCRHDLVDGHNFMSRYFPGTLTMFINM